MKLIKLEAIRGFAALYVVIHHTTHFDGLLGYAFRFGQEAVILFFLMSGFVINISSYRSVDKGFFDYFKKRFYRIYVPLFFVIILVAMISNEFNYTNLFGNIFMLQDIERLRPGALFPPLGGNSPLWYLSYEWWFYMMFYPLSRIKSESKRNKVAYLISVCGAILYLFYPIYAFRVLFYFAIWWAGVSMSQLYLKEHMSIKAALPILMALISFLILSILSTYLNADNIKSIGVFPLIDIRYFSFAIFAILFGLIWSHLKWAYFWPIEKLALFAPISYVMYIAHVPINKIMTENGNTNWLTFFVVMIIFSYSIERLVYPRIMLLLKSRNTHI